MNLQIYRHFSQILTLEKAYQKDGRNLVYDDLSIIANGSVVFNDEKILWVGPDSEIPKEYRDEPFKSFVGQTLIPEIVDAHTHLVFAGNRANEYCMRLNGADYQEIARAGGGILSTMKATRLLERNALFELAKKRVMDLYSYGVGTIEIKSGYGLSYEKEKEISQIINDLKNFFRNKIQIKNTFMAAHALPNEYSSSGEYMHKVTLPLLQELFDLKIIDAVDIFFEEGNFNKKDVTDLFTLSQKLQIPLKVHADEFNNNHGAKLAVKFQALSCDHLLETDDEGISALASSKTVAILLPGTALFLGKKQAPARKFLDAGVKVAIASDFNPGSCHFDNLLQIALISSMQYKLNPAELWTSITLNAAHALGLGQQGAIVAGLVPRFSLFSVKGHQEILYNWGKNLCVRD